ncbi:hybrid sensor histidine kinase/response regulator [Paraliobacillus salinarum]|uniref:hybrid sensor histidine kinase/response regulator n=1 Tax=Paraliobacillus salinarum TaxID=1158996 RepID=UPI0015F652F5|nr:ATP-binding protein [Paraliobacillus salinarum]
MANKKNSKKTIILFILIVMVVLSAARVGWIYSHKLPSTPEIQNGVLDLTDWSFSDHGVVALNGDWEYYPNTFLTPKETGNYVAESIYSSVPSNWEYQLSTDEEQLAYGYGTYRLQINLPNRDSNIYGIRVSNAIAAANVFINGELVSSINEPSRSPVANITDRGPFFGNFYTEEQTLDVVIHLSNFNIPFFKGLTEPVTFGLEEDVFKHHNESATLQAIISIMIFLHAVYAIILLIIGKGEFRTAIIYYGLMLLFYGTGNLIDDNVVVQLPIPMEISYKLLLLIFINTLMALLLFVKKIYAITHRSFHFFTITYILIVLGIVFAPFHLYTYLGLIIFPFYAIATIYLFIQSFRYILIGKEGSIFILLFICSYTSNSVWGFLIKMDIATIPYYPFDFLLVVVFITLWLFKQQIVMMRTNKEQKIELQHQDKKKDAFLAHTSHEIRNPLYAIINIAQVLLRESNHMTSEEKEKLKALINTGNQLTHTLNDMLNISRIKENKIKINRINVDLYRVATSTIGLIKYQAAAKNVTIHVDNRENFPCVYADEILITRIFFNLLDNAVKYTEEGSIYVSSDIKEGIAYITIQDTGIGISDEKLSKLFKPYETSNERSFTTSGIGLGLYLCKELIKLNNGSIKIESTLGKGTSVIFTLPVSPYSLTEVNQGNEEIISSFNFQENVLTRKRAAIKFLGRILIVDDDHINLHTLTYLLENKYDVVTAVDGKKALENLKGQTFDLVISDIMMPAMSGYELTEKIREQYTISQLPILLLTALHEIEDIEHGFQVGANDYITKPVNYVELEARIDALIMLKNSVNKQLQTEAAWYQAQMQPHFLFNTLNAIISLSEIDQSRMIDLLESFTDFLRRSFHFSNSSELVSMNEELSLAKSYANIMETRFQKLNVVWDVPTDLEGLIPPLTIQPLVENAINHGILNHRSDGTVSITITENNDHYSVSISDNGVGMDKEYVKQILDYNTSEGLGVSNTNRRLKQLYNQELIIVSELNKGTTISFSIPKNSNK